MQLKKGQIIDLQIEKLAFGGQGLGKYEGVVTFVSNVIPGDRVRASLTKIKQKRMEAQLVEVVEPSKLRVPARCKHFDRCGGCTWQNLTYEEQLKFKSEQVWETLKHLGGFSEDELERIMKPIVGYESEVGPWEYRNKMEFSFGTPSKEDQTPLLGLHLPKRRFDILNVEECFLPGGIAAEVVEVVREFAREEGLSVYHATRNEGFLRNLVVREGKNTGDVMVNLVTAPGDFKARERLIERLMTGEWAGRITSLLWTQKVQQRGVRTRMETQVLAGAPMIHEELRLESGEVLRFEVGPDAFFQPNTRQAQVLYGKAIELAGLTGKEVVYDLYCGTGTIGMFCAHAAREVYGIEINETAVKNAARNAAKNGIENVHFVAADVGKILSDVDFPRPDVVIVDPPRAGLSGDMPQQVVDLEAPVIVYVSCNPATLARDLRFLTQNGYVLDSVQPVDMFPQTTHIENVSLLKKT